MDPIHDLTYHLVSRRVHTIILGLSKCIIKVDFNRVDKLIHDAVRISVVPIYTLGVFIAFAVEETERT